MNTEYEQTYHTPVDAVRAMREYAHSQRDYIEAAGLCPRETGRAIQGLARDLRTVYRVNPDGLRQGYISAEQLAMWQDAVVHIPTAYGVDAEEGWGLVHKDVSRDIGTGLGRYASRKPDEIGLDVVGRPSGDELESLLIDEPERVMHPNVAKKLGLKGDTNASFLLACIHTYSAQHPEWTVFELVEYLREITSDASCGQTKALPTTLSRLETGINKAYFEDNPDKAEMYAAVVATMKNLVEDVYRLLDEEPDIQRSDLQGRIEGRLRSALAAFKDDAWVEDHIGMYMDTLMSYIPNTEIDRGLRKSFPSQRALKEAKQVAEMIVDERAPDVYGLQRMIKGAQKNRFVRLVPREPGVAESVHPSAILDKDDNRERLEELPLFYTISADTAQRASYAIESAVQNREELVIFVPTCPCDEICAAENDEYAIEFTGGPLRDGISWTGLNTLDALTALMPKLQKKLPEGTRIRIVFGTGDFEWNNGSTRGMSEEDYYAQLSRNHHTLAQRIQEHWYPESELRVKTREKVDETDEIEFKSPSGNLTIQIGGLMALAGGADQWRGYQDTVRSQIETLFESEEERDRLLALAETRRVIYESLRGNQELSAEELLTCLQEDVLDYCVAHNLARAYDEYGRRTLLLAGDSRPMEQLASEITGTILLSVAGGYQGSK